MLRPSVLAALCGGLFAASAALAYQPLITDDTGTQGAGGNQLEIAWEHASAKAAGVTAKADAVPLTYTHGFTDALDVAIGLPWVSTDASGSNKSGSGNPELAVKWRFYEEKDGWSAALKPEVAFPVSASKEADGLGDHATSYALSLLLSRDTSFGELHINLGTGHTSAAGADSDSYHLSVAPAWKLSDTSLIALDVGLDHDSAADDFSHYALLGLVYTPNDSFDVAFGLQKVFSVPGVDSAWSISAGLTWHLK
jgi:hypothetical protein